MKIEDGTNNGIKIREECTFIIFLEEEIAQIPNKKLGRMSNACVCVCVCVGGGYSLKKKSHRLPNF